MEKSLVKLFISFTENLKSMLRPLFHFNVAISCTAHPQFAAGYHRIGRCFVVSAALQEAVSHNQATGTSACPHGHWGGTDKGIWFHLLSKTHNRTPATVCLKPTPPLFITSHLLRFFIMFYLFILPFLKHDAVVILVKLFSLKQIR